MSNRSGDNIPNEARFPIPEGLARTAIEVCGRAGHDWVQRLPRVLAEYEDRWTLRLQAPFPLSYNYVAPAVRADGSPAVLKVYLPKGDEYTYQPEALRFFAGRGVTELLEIDRHAGVVLLERLLPGTTLQLVEETQAITIAADVMRQLWAPLPANHPFKTVEQWGKGFARLRSMFEGTAGPLPRSIFERGEALFFELLASSGEPVLLHGDLHFENILAAQRHPWLAIDPKGVAGEPVYETGDLLRNRVDELLAAPHPRRAMARRVDQLAAELGFDRDRIRDWGLAQAVLSAVWSVEDHGYGWEEAIACVELLSHV